MELFDQLRGVIGLAVLLALAWGFSENRAAHPGWRWMLGALALQGLLAVLIVRVPFVWEAVGLANTAVSAVEQATLKGSSYMFGYLGGGELPFALKDGAQPPLVIAFQILPLVIVFSALAALLWHWGVLRWLVNGLSFLLRRSLGVSGVVGLSGGANMFLGVVESPLVVRAYFDRMSRAVSGDGAGDGDHQRCDPDPLRHHLARYCARCGRPHDFRLADLAARRAADCAADGAGDGRGQRHRRRQGRTRPAL
ncbi:MAG: hypothetical protein NWS68_05000 [Erythrobacter sp.]|nr:hypothetical protein [Erythrobacter sp.]